jgi:hypothetical protein
MSLHPACAALPRMSDGELALDIGANGLREPLTLTPTASCWTAAIAPKRASASSSRRP